MDQLHSITLLLALLASGLGALAGLASLVLRARGRRSSDPLLLTARLGAALGVGSGLVSLLVHLRFGHGPGSATPLRFVELVALHPAYLVVVAAAALALAGSMAGRRRSGSRA